MYYITFCELLQTKVQYNTLFNTLILVFFEYYRGQYIILTKYLFSSILNIKQRAYYQLLKQHFFAFFPLPQVQGALRSIFAETAC